MQEPRFARATQGASQSRRCHPNAFSRLENIAINRSPVIPTAAMIARASSATAMETILAQNSARCDGVSAIAMITEASQNAG